MSGRALALTLRSKEKEIQAHPEIKKIDEEIQRKRDQLEQLSKTAQQPG